MNNLHKKKKVKKKKNHAPPGAQRERVHSFGGKRVRGGEASGKLGAERVGEEKGKRALSSKEREGVVEGLGLSGQAKPCDCISKEVAQERVGESRERKELGGKNHAHKLLEGVSFLRKRGE